MQKHLQNKRKERIAELENDLLILKGMTAFPKEEARIELVQKKLGKDFEKEIKPIINKYNLYRQIVNNEIIEWSSKIHAVITDLEDRLEVEQERLKKNSWWHSPPWIVRILTGVTIAILSFLAGKYWG